MRKLDNFVYVRRLHAVQFGNNWMKEILRTAKINRFQISDFYCFALFTKVMTLTVFTEITSMKENRNTNT